MLVSAEKQRPAYAVAAPWRSLQLLIPIMHVVCGECLILRFVRGIGRLAVVGCVLGFLIQVLR